MRVQSSVAVVVVFLGAVALGPSMLRGQTSQPPATTADEASVPRVSLADLKKLHDAGTVVVLDVRGVEAYHDGHIPGAVSVPLAILESRVATWQNAEKPIVTYCS